MEKALVVEFRIPNKKGRGFVGKFFGKTVLPPQEEQGYYDILEYLEKPNYILAKRIRKHICKVFKNGYCIGCRKECSHVDKEKTIKVRDDKDCHEVIEKCRVCGKEFSHTEAHKFEVVEENKLICKICGYRKEVPEYEYRFLKEKPQNIFDFIRIFEIRREEVERAKELLSRSKLSLEIRLYGRKLFLQKVKDFLNKKKITIDEDYNVYFSNEIEVERITYFRPKFQEGFLISLEDTKPIGYEERELFEGEEKKAVLKKLHRDYGKLLKHAKFISEKKIDVEKLINVLEKKLAEVETEEKEREKRIQDLRLKQIFDATAKYLPASVQNFSSFVCELYEVLSSKEFV